MLKETFRQRCTKRLTEIIIMVLSVSVIISIAWKHRDSSVIWEETDRKASVAGNHELTVWYNNEDYENYLNCLAEEYQKETGITLKLQYISDIDYFDSINKANKHTDDTYGNPPDVYMLSSEELEEAYGYGLAAENDSPLYQSDTYSETALRAITYKGKYVAYPLAFDTAFMIYNVGYLQSPPESIESIMSYESSFDWEANPNISHVMYFNLSDILHTYAFAGAYINVGGEYGDNKDILQLDTENLTKALSYYHSLSDRLRMNFDSNFEEIPKAFMEGNIICSIIDMKEFNEMRRMGNVREIKYNLCEIPPINAELDTKALSYTEVLVVNYLSDKEEAAKELAEYASYYRTDLIYSNTGMLPAKHVDYVDSYNETIQRQYEHSGILPKFRVTKDFYLQMQSLLNGAWKGNDISDMIQNISETYKIRLQ